MESTHWDVLHGVVRDCTLALFDSLEVGLEYRGHHPIGTSVSTIAVLGFGGDPLKGSVVFEAPDGFLRHSMPFESPSANALADWAGELSNQLCGRIKNRLLDHGVTIRLGTPTVIQGRVSTVTGEPTIMSAHQFITARGELVSVRFSAVATADLHLTLEPMASDVAEEGDCLLF